MAKTGPVIVRNTHDLRRVWPELTTVSGHTLELGPGDEDMLPEHPGEVAHLKIRPVKADPVDTGGN